MFSPLLVADENALIDGFVVPNPLLSGFLKEKRALMYDFVDVIR